MPLFLPLKLQILQPHTICLLSLIPLALLNVLKPKSKWQSCHFDCVLTHDILLIFHKMCCWWVAAVRRLTHFFCENVTVTFMPITVQAAKTPSPVQWNLVQSSLVQAQILTSLTRASQVACPRAVAHVAIPALPADSVMLAGVGQALFWWLSGTWGLHTHCPLGLSQSPDVLALPVHKQVSDAANVAVVQQSCPHLWKKSAALSSFTGRNLTMLCRFVGRLKAKLNIYLKVAQNTVKS